jgi:hypothetical protein
MHLEKHSRDQCKDYKISFLTIYKYHSEILKFQELITEKWHLRFEICHKCQPHGPSKYAKNNSQITRTLEAVINSVNRLYAFSGFILHSTVYKNI